MPAGRASSRPCRLIPLSGLKVVRLREGSEDFPCRTDVGGIATHVDPAAVTSVGAYACCVSDLARVFKWVENRVSHLLCVLHDAVLGAGVSTLTEPRRALLDIPPVWLAATPLSGVVAVSGSTSPAPGYYQGA